MKHLLGLDIGATGTKALLCDERGIVLVAATAEHTLSAPFPAWSEQNPADWWRGAEVVTRASDYIHGVILPVDGGWLAR